MRDTFLTTAVAVAALLDDDAVAAAWSAPSALPGMTVGGLAAHTGRAVLTVQQYLAAPSPEDDADVVDAAGYLVTALPDPTAASDVSKQVLARAEAAGGDGAATTAARVRDAVEELRTALAAAPSDRLLGVLGGIAIGLDDYLATRVLELVVHVDDLAASVPTSVRPVLPQAAEAVAVALLAETARRRHGTTALVTTFARRERAPVTPPRAF